MNLRRVYAISRMESWRILRDRMSFSLILLVPAMQIALFGAAIDLNPKNVRVGLAGGSPAQIEQISKVLLESGYFSDPELFQVGVDTRRAVASGRLQVSIELPDHGDVFDDPEQELGPVVVSIDGADAGAVLPAIAALERSMWTQAATRLAEETGRKGALNRLKNIDVQWLYNPEKRTAWTLLPGLIGVVIMISMLMLGALCFAREREEGSLEALRFMPLSSVELGFGKITPYLIVALVQILLVVITAVAVFDVPLRGSVAVLLSLAILVATVHLLLGLIVSILVKNQLQALQAAVAFYLPSMLLSGFMFPFSGMPTWAQHIGTALPLTHFVSAARDVMLKGYQGWPNAQVIVLLVFTFSLSAVLIVLLKRQAKNCP